MRQCFTKIIYVMVDTINRMEADWCAWTDVRQTSLYKHVS